MSKHINFVPLLDTLGYYFQIRDDYLNVSSDAYMQTKSYCEDLTEGKYSFPIIHAIRSYPKDTRLVNIIKQRTENYELKKYAVTYMYMCGSMTYTRNILKQLHTELLTEIENVGGHGELTALMKHLDQELDREPTVVIPGSGSGSGVGHHNNTAMSNTGSGNPNNQANNTNNTDTSITTEAPNPVMSSSIQHSIYAANTVPYSNNNNRTISPKISTL